MSLRQKLDEALESIKDGGKAVVNFEEDGRVATIIFNKFFGEHVNTGVDMRCSQGKKVITLSRNPVARSAPAPEPTPEPTPEPAPEPVAEESVEESVEDPKPKAFDRFKSWSLDEKEDE